MKADKNTHWIRASDINVVNYCPYKLEHSLQGKKQDRRSVARMKDGDNKHEMVSEAALSGSGSSRCYLATYAFGETHPTTYALRQWRDDVLLKTLTGRLLVSIYYVVSPWMIRRFGPNMTFRRVVKMSVDCFCRRCIKS